MSDVQETCVQADRSEPESFGIRKLALIRIHTGKPGSMGSSVTLVRTVTSWVVVDSGGPSDREKIKGEFVAKRLPLEKVNVLLSTSLDPAFSGNDEIFPHALHHVKRSDWAKVKGPNPRRVVINTPYHWIDKYMKIVKVIEPDEEKLVLLVHFPRTEELLEPGCREMAGKVVGILGRALVSASEPANAALIGEAKRKRASGAARPDNPTTLPEILLYCDIIIPGQGEPINLI